MSHRAFYKADRRTCYVCAEPFEVDSESSEAMCSDDCRAEHDRRDRIETARAQLRGIPAHNENQKCLSHVIERLDSLYENDSIDSLEEAGEEGAELDAFERLAMVARIVERLQAHVSTELDPRMFEGLNDLSHVLAGLPTEDDLDAAFRVPSLKDTLALLRRYAEHHEAHKADNGTIDAEVDTFLRNAGVAL